jgi:hypothetical protein
MAERSPRELRSVFTIDAIEKDDVKMWIEAMSEESES